jgi:hypothetical protein
MKFLFGFDKRHKVIDLFIGLGIVTFATVMLNAKALTPLVRFAVANPQQIE